VKTSFLGEYLNLKRNKTQVARAQFVLDKNINTITIKVGCIEMRKSLKKHFGHSTSQKEVKDISVNLGFKSEIYYKKFVFDCIEWKQEVGHKIKWLVIRNVVINI